MRLGRPAEALRVYQSALRFAPEDPDLLYNLGVLLLGEGRAEEALRAWDRALEGDPSHRQALLGAAVLVQERGMTGGGRRRQAVERLRRLAEEQEGDGGGAGVDEKVYFHLGMLTADEGGEEAAKVCKFLPLLSLMLMCLLLLLPPFLCYCRCKCCCCCCCCCLFDHVTSNRETHTRGRTLRSLLYLNYPMSLQDAERWFRLAVSSSPDFRPALFNLALLLSDGGRPLEAEPFLRRLLRAHPDHIKGLVRRD